jgi:hypothetical protein
LELLAVLRLIPASNRRRTDCAWVVAYSPLGGRKNY